MAVTLAQIARLLEGADLLASSPHLELAADTPVSGADCDSRFVRPGHLFIAKGVAFREAYLTSALDSGAVAYLCGEDRAEALATVAPNVPALVTHDVRRAMALVSPLAWDQPDRWLHVVGVTGTKGKSTTCCMLQSIIDCNAPSPRTALMGSIETFDGIERAASVNTTPESPDLWRHVANAHESGLTHLVMEVSSQALKYDRVVGLGLEVAAFLNIGLDHISAVEHPDFEDYFASKLRIFAQSRSAVVNLGCDHLDRVLEAADACPRLVTFSFDGQGVAGRTPDIWASDVRTDGAGMRFVAHTPTWTDEVRLSLAGSFNVENALAAIAISEVLGLDREQVLSGLARVRVPGRMEVVTSRDGKVTGIIDFAHNKMAFSKLFPVVAAQYPGQPILSVFGAVGGKAVERRTELPQIAAQWSTRLIYTEDDPGIEPVEDICAAMVQATPSDVPCEVVLDRAEAVQRAVNLAYEMDGPVVVCVLCRGTEPTQHRGTRFEPVPLDAELFERALAPYGG